MLIRAADSLSLDQLQQLQAAIADLVIAKQAEVEQLELVAEDGAAVDNAGARSGGYIEEKQINGCPYR